jgi:hypothetical protein
MKKTKLVTAFYTQIHGHPYYGHIEESRHERYLNSMRVLNNLNLEIVCFCNENQYDVLKTHIELYELNNVKLKISNLSDLPFSERMKEIKEKKDNFKFYHEVDWNKIYLMGKEYDESYDYLYWIDVGLSHHGIFPNRYNPNYKLSTGMSDDFNTYSFTNLFTNNLFEGINKFVGKKLINLENELRFHNVDEINSVYKSNFSFQCLTVGGILGGHISKIKWFIDTFNALGKISLDQEIILNHEAIISFMKESNKENFESFSFQTWYHEDTKNIPKKILENQIHFCHFFDLIFKRYVS